MGVNRRKFLKITGMCALGAAAVPKEALAEIANPFEWLSEQLGGFTPSEVLLHLGHRPAGFKPAAGTYFQLLDYSAISDEDDVGYARRLTREHGIASIPISVFCAAEPPRQILRFCFAKDTATLDRAAEILCAL